MAAKIFVFGSINGQFSSAFEKLGALHAKNSFNFAIVAGNLFAEDGGDDELTKLFNGEIAVPCATYFTVGTTSLPTRVTERLLRDEDVAENLHFLGKRSVTKTTDGVRIVALGGKLENAIEMRSEDQFSPSHTVNDVKAMCETKNADILLTTLWPQGVLNKSDKQLPVAPDTLPFSDSLTDLCRALKPRYHFASSPANFYLEREPYINHSDDGGISVTRFISLPPWGNADKAKAMYAFTLRQEEVTEPPPGSTPSPFFQPRKRQADDAGFSRFANDRPRKNRRTNRPPPPGPDQCYFCLSAPSADKHMICDVNEETYLASAKGPLPAADTFKDFGLECPCHVIITPIAHVPKLHKNLLAESTANTYREMVKSKEDLQNMVATRSQDKLGAVTWEISRERNIHVHWQFLPVMIDLIRETIGGKSKVEAAFRVVAQDLGLGTFEEVDFETADQLEGDYFRVWIWGKTDEGIVSKSLVMRFDHSVRFDLQYPRKVMAKLLGLEHRAIWQDVQQTKAEEEADVLVLREALQ